MGLEKGFKGWRVLGTPSLVKEHFGSMGLGFRIWGLGFRIWGLGFRV